MGHGLQRINKVLTGVVFCGSWVEGANIILTGVGSAGHGL